MPLFGVAGSLIEGFGELFSGLFDAARARRQAHDVRSRAKADIYDAARDFRARQGEAETAIGKSGLQVEGSALDHLLDQAEAHGREVGAIKAEAREQRRLLEARARLETGGALTGAATTWLGAGRTLFQ